MPSERDVRMSAPGAGEQVEADHGPEYFAEIAGRTRRTTRFRIRPVRPIDVTPDDPRRYILEVTLGNMTTLHAMTEADISRLGVVCVLATGGEPLPLEG